MHNRRASAAQTSQEHKHQSGNAAVESSEEAIQEPASPLQAEFAAMHRRIRTVFAETANAESDDQPQQSQDEPRKVDAT